MKKLYGLIVICTIFGIMQGFSQNIPSYPIPSFGISVDGFVNFKNRSIQNDNCDNLREKRVAKVHLRSAFEENPECQATVWVYTLDYTTILGPFTVLCDETLTVEIDEREWGVLVESEFEVIVDVWFE